MKRSIVMPAYTEVATIAVSVRFLVPDGADGRVALLDPEGRLRVNELQGGLPQRLGGQSGRLVRRT